MAMDIRKWLNETVLPEQPPTLPEHLGLAPFLRVKEVEQQERRPPRKRNTSDSSLLEARPRRRKTHVHEELQVDHAAPIERESDIVDDSASGSCCSNASSRCTSSQLSQPHARKPRRKTRPERYEPAPAKGVKERGTHVHHRRKGESIKTKRKSRRKKADKPGIGLVQSFHAKNVHGDRLTLKPREKLGIFSKGRASSPVKGRGLPDLVFSEMKFLQKHKDQPDTAPQSGLSKKKRKKDHAFAREEEISAYFTSVRPPLAEKDVNTQAKGATHPTAGAQNRGHNHEPEGSSVIGNAIPTVELADKESYLGFGSRGPQHDSGSYISWSDSVRAPSATTIRRRAGSTINNGQLDALPGQSNEAVTNGGDMLHSPTRHSSIARRRTDDSKERFKVSSVATPSHRISRSQSYPQRTCSPYPLNPNYGPFRRRTADTGASPSSMPPPKSLTKRIDQDRPMRPQAQLRMGMKQSPDPVEERERPTRRAETLYEEARLSASDSGEPQTSSSLGKLLQECDSAFDERRRQEPTVRELNNLQAEHVAEQSNAKRVLNQLPTRATRKTPTVRFAHVQEFVPPMPNVTGPGIYEEQERRQHLFEATGAFDLGMQHHVHDECEDATEEEEDVECDDQNWNGNTLPELGGSHNVESTAFEEGEAAMYQLEEPRAISGQGDSVVSRGFWRPHRLY
ncbi:hypothetical protein BDV96DRAFT_643794 [Lophiotrema nucula]|uniref:Uncharacterized protein n=1 Tax=Lophiotrema nucula TaxID=690887 RepID=A0A6A5ZGD7_9PLEO|nr:hypothetical protein BDV96DRAFT_643794 [Lophiotrema nucula]